jgi:hypothetical protein
MLGAGAVHGEDLKACVLMEELLVGEHAVVSEITFPADQARGQAVGVAVILLDLERAVETCGDPAYHCMCSMQVVDITPIKHRLTSITSIRVVQQKHRRSTVCLIGLQFSAYKRSSEPPQQVEV